MSVRSTWPVFSSEVNVSIPMKTRNNGTLYVHIYLAPPGEDPFYGSWKKYQNGPLTSFAIPQAVAFQLVSESKEKVEKTLFSKAIHSFRIAKD